MTRRPPIPILVIVMLAFFVFGVLTVIVSQRSRPRSVSPAPTATIISPRRPEQQTIILLGVDDLGRASPSLEAVWFATYRLPAKDLFLFGMPIDLRSHDDSPEDLGDLFAWDEDRGVDPGFLNAVHQIVPLEPNAIIVLDEHGFSALVDYLGGIDVNGAQMNGTQVVSVLGLVRDNPQALLTTQQHFVESMASRVADLEAHPDLTPLLAILPEHAYLSVDMKVLVDAVAPLLPLEPASIHIDLPWDQATPTP